MSDNVIKFDFIDELKIEGIKFKGYGVLPKFVMLDTDLSVVAKGIYAYFCSYAGNGNTAFPSRDKIISDLQINKDTYYKHFNVITEQGYITVKQDNSGGRGVGFSKNIYTLVSNPKKFEDKPEESRLNQAYMRIRFGGLEAAGYGFIPKAVMLDSRLPIEAKAIYAYFCGFTGSGNAAFPKVPVLVHHLQIAKNTYYKYFRLLLDTNYITPVQRHIDGRLSVNDYYLNSNPDAASVSPKTVMTVSNQCTKFSDTQKTDAEIQCTKFSDTQKTDAEIQCTKFSDTQKQDTQKQDTQKPDTNINSPKKNNSFITQIQSINQAAQPHKPAKPVFDRESEEEYIENVELELYNAKTLPYDFMFDDRKLTAAIRLMTEWESRNKYYNELPIQERKNDAELKHGAFNLFVEALIEMLTASDKPMKLKGAYITYSKVYDRLTPYIKPCSGFTRGDDYYTGIYLETVEDAAVEGFINGCRDSEIINHLQYMKSCIWTALQTGEIGVLAQIKHDFG